MEEFVPVILSLGSNLGSRESYIQEAIMQLSKAVGDVQQVSDFHYSEPLGFESNHTFCNVCCLLHTVLKPEDVLREIMAIEQAMGRTRHLNAYRYEDRIIDIDIIFFGNEVLEATNLTIPHPRWRERTFVLVPLVQVLWAKISNT
ncbi:MAG: 2-amino-4-hydroxy-6-hydroxymethyldihydropteridine diphosphokinase [Flavobacteriales bacterium]